MPSILNNFVALRKTKGDVLDPASHRTIVEMILGILKRYNFDEFNSAYSDFLNHLIDFDDPHHVANASFIEEILERTYVIYSKMTATPASESFFRSDIVPSIAFMELIRRIVLNRYLYDRIKNTDGSVPATVSVTLSGEWGHHAAGNTPVVLSFGSVLANEDAFLAKGWGVNSTPIPVVFHANDLVTELHQTQCIFHISPQTPHFGSNGSVTNYPVELPLSSNDVSITLRVDNSPLIQTSVMSLLSGNHSFNVTVNPNRSLVLKLDDSTIYPDISCNEGICVISINRFGNIEVAAMNNGTFVSTFIVVVDFSTIGVFSTVMIEAPVSNIFTTDFGISELTVNRDFIPSGN